MPRMQAQSPNPAALLAMLELSGDSSQDWYPQELASILKHELAAPLPLALGGLSQNLGHVLEKLEPGTPAPRTLEELFLQSHPSIELLRLIKKFAKRCSNGREAGLPRELSLLLYYLSIALARMRCHARLSELPDAALEKGLQWCIAQDWVGKSIRCILDEALDWLGGESGRQRLSLA